MSILFPFIFVIQSIFFSSYFLSILLQFFIYFIIKKNAGVANISAIYSSTFHLTLFILFYKYIFHKKRKNVYSKTCFLNLKNNRKKKKKLKIERRSHIYFEYTNYLFFFFSIYRKTNFRITRRNDSISFFVRFIFILPLVLFFKSVFYLSIWFFYFFILTGVGSKKE